MKIRTDFVTNSSSSSFILGKNDESITKEIVFEFMKEFYKEYLEKKILLEKDASKFKIHYNSEKGKFEFDNPDYSDKHWKINEQLEKNYGISTWDYFNFNQEWLDFETYDEYQNYWLSKIKENPRVHASFSIIDYLNDKEFYEVHYNGEYGQKKHIPPFNASEYSEFGWYVACDREIFEENILDTDKSFPENCEVCEYCHFERNDENCKIFINGVKSGKITNANAISLVLGTVCVHSECGYIPDYIVNKLKGICDFSCNHMG